MYLIVWLGNPWPEYATTKHNIGWIAMDLLLDRMQICPKRSYDKDAKAEVWIQEIDNSTFDTDIWWDKDKLIRVKPQTYMNLSWGSVAYLSRYYKVPPSKILVLHDDLDLEVGKIKYKPKWSSWWQNGIKDIINKLWTQEFYRIKIGIGRPTNPWYDIVRYVLSKLSKSELKILDENIPIIFKSLQLFLQWKC